MGLLDDINPLADDDEPTLPDGRPDDYENPDIASLEQVGENGTTAGDARDDDRGEARESQQQEQNQI